MHFRKPQVNVMPKANNVSYLIAIVIMVVVAILSIVSVTIFVPDKDHTQIISLIIGVLAPTTISLLALMKAQETHLSVNSRLDDFMKGAAEVALEQGRKEGRMEVYDANQDPPLGTAPPPKP